MSLPMHPPQPSLDDLLQPLSDAAPCGTNPRYDADYDRLREARREDDASLPTGVWQAEIKRGDWPLVEQLASDLLLKRSKDLMIAAWLGEAWLHRRGLEGLEQALLLLVGLCERYPDDLHPQAEEGDQSWRATPLDWLYRRYAEILHTRLRLFEITSDEFGSYTLNDWQQLQHRQVLSGDNKAAKADAEAARHAQQKLDERVRAAPLAYFQRCRANLESATHSLQRLEAWSDTHLGDSSPTCSPLRDVIVQLTALMEEFIAMHPQPSILPVVTEQPENTEAGTQQSGVVIPAAPMVLATPSSREDAYRQLMLIADYLAKTEPHSPVPYLIKRAVEWGNKPLSELLGELITADSESRRVWALLGVLP
ncbi:type VI secretion system protein TssA [Pseudomonas indica]|uniref:Type VI secretion system protein ImpA n=1 Tax=Pseudomonas indica TaxID=137658 RepID=A0A1G8ZYH3_9PSED|nr:type VI secretion system protein TssA [Pseudomonas indica]SDK20189.1 type VI secretion system protein ImpA [Pseudomonas indica]